MTHPQQPMKRVSLECAGVGFAYGRLEVLERIDLSIPDGLSVGVIGPNGSGKTTLIKILSGLLPPARGKVLLNGRDLGACSKRQAARELAVVAQEDRSDFGFTVRQEVMLGRAPHHGGLHFDGAEDQALVELAMQQARVEHLAERHVDALSGGERRRVKIARGLAQRPKVLLLDEPTNHLDLYSQLSLMELMKEINGRDIGILLVSHDINFVAASCHRVSILHSGTLLASGSPEEVISEQNLAAAFNIRALVDANPVTGKPRMTPIQRLSTDGNNGLSNP